MILKIDDGTYYAVFALLCCLVILYMAWDFQNAVNEATKAVTISKCNEMLTERLKNETILPIDWR